MKFRKRVITRALDLVAELNDDDGIDPRKMFSRIQRRDAAHDRKTSQLCKEAARAIQTALSCDFRDPLLNDLEVVSVAPAAGAGQLSVFVRFAGDPRMADESAIAARLAAVSGFLRAQVASSVSRKRAAELRFTVLPTKGGAT